jgi:NitT/TauT family transport system substrate-binding protein
MAATSLQSFSAVAENIPTVVVAAAFQKEPQVLLAHPDQGFEKFEDLKKATLFIASEGQQTYFKWMQAEFGFAPRR